jgi:hypothetical protein
MPRSQVKATYLRRAKPIAAHLVHVLGFEELRLAVGSA